ncbi:MAG: NADPH-dependent FMN reductase [Acidimicrobiales bacterium]
MRAAIRHVDALVVSTLEYAGALPGWFKNMLDWMIGDDQPGSIYRKPVGWINVSAYGAVDAHDSLRKVLCYASADVVDPACRDVPVARSMITTTGLIADPDVQKAMLGILQLLSNHVLSRERTEWRLLHGGARWRSLYRS